LSLPRIVGLVRADEAMVRSITPIGAALFISEHDARNSDCSGSLQRPWIRPGDPHVSRRDWALLPVPFSLLPILLIVGYALSRTPGLAAGRPLVGRERDIP
jgi:hypothetical protein